MMLDLTNEITEMAASSAPHFQAAMNDWAGVVRDLEGAELAAALAEKMITLRGVVEDPLGECMMALRRVTTSGSAAVRRPEAAGPGISAEPGRIFLDWPNLWRGGHTVADWLYPQVLARGRGHAIYAAHKAGKSLFMLHVAAHMATVVPLVVVLYLDYEMTEDDVRERLEDMGYGSDSDLSRLHYALLPSLPPLDTARGGQRLMDIVDDLNSDHPRHHLVVVIDTISRAVQGDEDKADTYRNFYAHTGIQLKRRGVTWVRLDHSGKDAERGQRGSSSKGDDPDIVWRLVSSGDVLRLQRQAARMPWVPPKVVFTRLEDPHLGFAFHPEQWPPGTEEVADDLERLAVPLQAPTREAAAALQAAGRGRRRGIVVAAKRFREWRAQQGLEQANGGSGSSAALAPDPTVPEPGSDGHVLTSELQREPFGTVTSEHSGTGFPLLGGEPVPGADDLGERCDSKETSGAGPSREAASSAGTTTPPLST